MQQSNESKNSSADFNIDLPEVNSIEFHKSSWNMSPWPNTFGVDFLKAYEIEKLKETNAANQNPSSSTFSESQSAITDEFRIFFDSIKCFEKETLQNNETANRLVANTLEKINNDRINPFVNNDLYMEKQKKNKPLNENAIKIMEAWYTNNIDFPYPSNAIKKNMAQEGNIGVTQVNSWFANRRNRSDNTKPKKNRKQLQVRLYKFAQELEINSEGRLKAYEIATKMNRMIDEYLS